MTNRKTKPSFDLSLLKGVLIASALASTLLGTRLLSNGEQDLAADASNANAAISAEAISQPSLPISARISDKDKVLVIDLAPIPQVVSPAIQQIQMPSVQPVARTRTS